MGHVRIAAEIKPCLYRVADSQEFDASKWSSGPAWVHMQVLPKVLQ